MSDKINTRLKDINIKDLIFVILYGGVISLLVGIVFGLIDYYAQTYLSFSFSMILFFMSAQYIGNLVRKQYDYPHIVYSVITGVALALQAIIIYGLPVIFPIALELGDLSYIFDIVTYLKIFILFIETIFVQFNFYYILILLILGVGTYLGVSKTY